MTAERIHRLLKLITLLQAGRARTAEDLLAEIQVSRRTLFRDLKLLQEAGIPCYNEPGKGYRIAEQYQLPPINLTVHETLGLMLLGKTAGAQRRRPLMDHALTAVNKLITTVPPSIRAACADMMAHVSVDVQPRGDSERERRNYAALQQCLDEHRACRLCINRPHDDAPKTLAFEPYALHFADAAWHAFGRTEDDRIEAIPLPHIHDVRPTDHRFQRPRRFRVDEHLGDAWRLKPEGRVHDIELHVRRRAAAAVTEMRWHRSQKQHPLPGGDVKLTFRVDGLEEIARWIVGFGPDLQVVRPDELRERVAAILAQALRQYN